MIGIKTKEIRWKSVVKFVKIMDDDRVQTFHTQNYVKAEALELPSSLQRTLMIMKMLPSLAVKALIVAVLPFYFLLLSIYHLFVPKTLKDIRGRLAAVGVTHRLKSIQINIQLENLF